MKLAEKLKNVRLGYGIKSRRRWSELTGLSPRSVENWERGVRVPDTGTLLYYRHLMHCDSFKKKILSISHRKAL